MGLALTTPPALEPVPLAEAKTYLRVTTTTGDDALISGLITAARITLERLTGLALITQGWTFSGTLMSSEQDIILPVTPILALTSLKLDGTVIAPSLISTNFAERPARLVAKAGNWPVLSAAVPFECVMMAGYGPDALSVPEPLRRAILMLAAFWYERRGAGSGDFAIPKGFHDLIGPWVGRRLL